VQSLQSHSFKALSHIVEDVGKCSKLQLGWTGYANGETSALRECGAVSRLFFFLRLRLLWRKHQMILEKNVIGSVGRISGSPGW
jgi:hypothetical protein